MKLKICRVGFAMLALAIVLIPGTLARACLRENLDARAVQWSTLIVQAKLVSVGQPVPLAAIADASIADPGPSYRIYAFTVTSTLDGSAKTGDSINVVRFNVVSDNPSCDVDLTDDQVGKEFLLLLLPEADLSWSRDSADPRTASLHAIKAYAPVYMAAMADVGADGITDTKNLIDDTRKSQAQYTDAMARVQAQTLAGAADDTEASEAQKSLTEMGLQALPAVQAVFKQSDEVGKARLTEVIQAIQLPPLAGSNKVVLEKSSPATQPGN